MSKGKFLTSKLMLCAYASIALLIPSPPLPLAVLGIVALSRSGVSAAVQAFKHASGTEILSNPENTRDDYDDTTINNSYDSNYENEDSDIKDTLKTNDDSHQLESYTSRELLTNAPTPSPTQITNCASSGAGSFLAAFTNAKNSGGGYCL